MDIMRGRGFESVRGNPLVLGTGACLVVAYLGVTVWAMDHVAFATWSLLVYIPLIIAITVPVIIVVSHGDRQPVTHLIIVGLVLKLGAAFLRYFVIFSIYGGVADAATYDDAGRLIANGYWSGKVSLTDLLPTGRGTDFMKQLTGAMYAVIGPSLMAGFVMFAWLGFWGLLLFQRAMVMGYPDGDQRRYAWCVFLLPSLLFWPSSIGKEAWMMFAIGLSAYGSARLLTRRPGGITLVVIGAVLGGVVRPHVSALLIVALTIAVAFRRAATGKRVSPARRFVVVFVMVVGSAFAISQAVHYFDPQGDTSLGAATNVLTQASRQTAEGSSFTEGANPNSPLRYPSAMFAVLFRPTLFEANNAQNAVAALETTVVLGALVLGYKRLKNLPAQMFRNPYLLFALSYAFMFTFAWSSFSNIGALARQRVQVWPLLLVVLAVPRQPVPEPQRAVAAATRRATPESGRPRLPTSALR